MPLIGRFGLFLFACLGAAAFALAAAAAQSVLEKAKDAKALAAAGRFAAALSALDDAAQLVWDKAPLSCRQIQWVAKTASGFGQYESRDTDVFASSETMLAYAEPIGFAWRKSGEIWHAELSADLVIRSKAGAELYRQKAFGRFPVASRVRNREFNLNFTFKLSGIARGAYVLETVLHDAVSGKEGTCALPFSIR
jgi:hypothetical protein